MIPKAVAFTDHMLKYLTGKTAKTSQLPLSLIIVTLSTNDQGCDKIGFFSSKAIHITLNKFWRLK